MKKESQKGLQRQRLIQWEYIGFWSLLAFCYIDPKFDVSISILSPLLLH